MNENYLPHAVNGMWPKTELSIIAANQYWADCLTLLAFLTSHVPVVPHSMVIVLLVLELIY